MILLEEEEEDEEEEVDDEDEDEDDDDEDEDEEEASALPPALLLPRGIRTHTALLTASKITSGSFEAEEALVVEAAVTGLVVFARPWRRRRRRALLRRGWRAPARGKETR